MFASGTGPAAYNISGGNQSFIGATGSFDSDFDEITRELKDVRVFSFVTEDFQVQYLRHLQLQHQYGHQYKDHLTEAVVLGLPVCNFVYFLGAPLVRSTCTHSIIRHDVCLYNKVMILVGARRI